MSLRPHAEIQQHLRHLTAPFFLSQRAVRSPHVCGSPPQNSATSTPTQPDASKEYPEPSKLPDPSAFLGWPLAGLCELEGKLALYQPKVPRVRGLVLEVDVEVEVIEQVLPLLLSLQDFCYS